MFPQSDQIGNFKIEKYEATLDKNSATNTYSTGITYTWYASISVVGWNDTISLPSSTGILNVVLNKNGTLTVTKENATYGGTNKLYITIIHD